MINYDQTFPLSLDYEGKHYSGKITPSEELGKDGTPVYFRVMVEGEFFAYLCCGDNGWSQRDENTRPRPLITAIGDYIKDFYE